MKTSTYWGQCESFGVDPRDLGKQMLCHIRCIHKRPVQCDFPGGASAETSDRMIYNTYHNDGVQFSVQHAFSYAFASPALNVELWDKQSTSIDFPYSACFPSSSDAYAGV